MSVTDTKWINIYVQANILSYANVYAFVVFQLKAIRVEVRWIFFWLLRIVARRCTFQDNSHNYTRNSLCLCSQVGLQYSVLKYYFSNLYNLNKRPFNWKLWRSFRILLYHLINNKKFETIIIIHIVHNFQLNRPLLKI